MTTGARGPATTQPKRAETMRSSEALKRKGPFLAEGAQSINREPFACYGRSITNIGEFHVSQCAGFELSPSALRTEIFA